jgi:hypothetical protein
MKLMRFWFLTAIVVTLQPMLSAAYYARVTGGYRHLIDKVVIIEGTLEDTLGIESLSSIKAKINSTIQLYLEQNPPSDGRVYCGYKGDLSYCFHETWLQFISPAQGKEEFAQQDDVVIAISPDGTIFGTQYNTTDDEKTDYGETTGKKTDFVICFK